MGGGGLVDKVKVGHEPGTLEDEQGVSTHCKHLSLLNTVVAIEDKHVRHVVHGSLVDDSLAIVLARKLKAFDLEEPESGTEKVCCGTELLLHSIVVDGDWSIRHEPWIIETDLPGQLEEIVPVHCSTETFSIQDLVVPQVGGDPAVRVDVTKVHLSSFCKKTVDLAKDLFLVRRKIDNTITDDQVEALFLQTKLVQLLDEAKKKLDVWRGKAKGLHVSRNVFLGGLDLLFGHVDSNDKACGSNELRNGEAILSSSTAQVKDAESSEGRVDGKSEAAAIVLCSHFFVDVLEGGDDVARWSLSWAASVGLEVLARLQDLAVVVLHLAVCRLCHLDPFSPNNSTKE